MFNLWKFLSDHLAENMIIQAIILYFQIPHMLWAADVAFLEGKLIAGVSTPLDFLLYGIDLVEWIAIVNVTLTLIAVRKQKKKTI